MSNNVTTATVEEIDRTLEATTVGPGDTTTVTVFIEFEEEIELATGEIVRFDDELSEAVEDIQHDSGSPEPGSAGSNQARDEYLAVWNEGADRYETAYELTVPGDAAEGSTISLEGAFEIAGDVEAVPDATITVEEPMPDVTGVELRPAEATGLVDDETTLELVVTGADEGIGSYAIDLSLDDTGVATFADVALTNPAETNDSTVADDSVTVEATLSEPHDAVASIPIAELTLDTGDEGETNIDVDSAAVSDPSDSEYNIEETAGATLAVTDGPPQLPGAEGPPQDINGDGLFEDVNGDGVVNIADVQFLFDNLDEPEVQENAEFYDFSGIGGGEVTIFDIQALFTRSQQMQG